MGKNKKQILLRKLCNNNSVWALFFLALKSSANFILAPYITNKVGIDAYGYIALANNLVMYIDVICVAFNYFAGRNISIEYHRGNYEKSGEYYSTILITDIALCVLLSLPALIIICFAEKIINISPHLGSDVKLLFMFILLRYFISLIATSLDVGAFIKDRLDLSNKNRIVSYSAYIFTTIICLSTFVPHIWYVGIATLFDACIFFALQFAAKNRLVSELKLKFSDFRFSTVKYLFYHGIWISFNNLGNILNDGLDLLITNLMISEIMVGMISIAKMLGNFCYSIVNAISNSYRPRQLEDFSKNDIEGLVKKLHKSMRINGMVFTFYIGCFVGCGKDFLNIWMKGQDINTLYYLTIIAILCFSVSSVVNPLYYVFVLVQKVRIPSYITIGMGLMNVLSMYLLLNYTRLGGYAVLITTAVLNLIHLVDTPLYAAYCLNIDWKSFYKPILFHFFNSCLCIGGVVLMSILFKDILSSVSYCILTVIGISILCVIMLKKNSCCS